LRALKNVQQNNWQLTFIGDGPNIEQVKRYAKENNVFHHIKFLGECRNVDEHLRDAHIFLLITKSEGLPISIIEAMSAQLAIIASNVGGIKELIDHNETGILVGRNDEDAISNAITHLLMNNSIREQLGSEARKKYLNEFTFTKMLNETEKYYKQVLLSFHNKKKEVMEG